MTDTFYCTLKNLDELKDSEINTIKILYNEALNNERVKIPLSNHNVTKEIVPIIEDNDIVTNIHLITYGLKYDKETYLDIFKIIKKNISLHNSRTSISKTERCTKWSSLEISYIIKTALLLYLGKQWGYTENYSNIYYTYKEMFQCLIDNYLEFIPYILNTQEILLLNISDLETLLNNGINIETIDNIIEVDRYTRRILIDVLKNKTSLEEYHNLLDFTKLKNIISNLFTNSVRANSILKWFLDKDLIKPYHINNYLFSKIFISDCIDKEIIRKIIKEKIIDINNLLNDNSYQYEIWNIFYYKRTLAEKIKYGKYKGSYNADRCINNFLLLLENRIEINNKIIKLLIDIGSSILFDEVMNYENIPLTIIEHIKDKYNG